MINNLYQEVLHLDKVIGYQIRNYNGVRFEDYFNYYYMSRDLENEILMLRHEIDNINNRESSNYVINLKTTSLKEKLVLLQNLLNACDAKINYIISANLPYLEVLVK